MQLNLRSRVRTSERKGSHFRGDLPAQGNPQCQTSYSVLPQYIHTTTNNSSSQWKLEIVELTGFTGGGDLGLFLRKAPLGGGMSRLAGRRAEADAVASTSHRSIWDWKARLRASDVLPRRVRGVSCELLPESLSALIMLRRRSSFCCLDRSLAADSSFNFRFACS